MLLDKEFLEVVTENGKLRVRIAELEAALKPFIEELVAAEAEYDELDDDELVYVFKITYGDLRAARAALKGEK
jgi:hypothetical protein